MPRMPIKKLRQNELIVAAYEVMKRHGIGGTTLARVAEEAGLSKGMILHYFADKEELIEMAMRRSNLVLRDEVVRRLKQAASPYDRLVAVIEGNFAPAFFQSEITHAWLAFCAEVPFNQQYRRLQTAIHARMRSNLLSGLRHLLPPAEAERVALGLSTLIDGLWLRCGLQDGGIDRQTALDQCYLYLHAFVQPNLGARRDRPMAS